MPFRQESMEAYEKSWQVFFAGMLAYWYAGMTWEPPMCFSISTNEDASIQYPFIVTKEHCKAIKGHVTHARVEL